jgi:curved DNA-binding protein CbpA
MSGAVEEERLRALPLAAVDRFVLSLVDGETSVGVLAETVGLTAEDVIVSLLKLEALGVVKLPSTSMAPPPPRPSRPSYPPRAPPLPHSYSQTSPPPPGTPHASPLRVAAPRAPAPTTTSAPLRTSPAAPASAPPAPVSPGAPVRAPQAAQGAPPPPPPAPPPVAARSPAPPPAASSAGTAGGASAKPTSDGEIDLDLDHQREIETKFARLDTIDHYAILGLERAADRKEIKRAYFALTARFHPDRFFRKRLGPFKPKMEALFGRMTEAHDTLTASDRRAEYDAYLGSIDKTRSIEQMLAEATAEMKRAEEATLGAAASSMPPPPSGVATARGVGPGSVPPPPSSRVPDSRAQPAPNAPQKTPSGSPGTSPNLGAFIADALDGKGTSKAPPNAARISVPPASSETPGARARRELLARRLTGGSMRVPAPPKLPTIGYAKTEDAVDALKRRYEDKVSAARTSQAKKYSEAGYAARARGDMVAAANSLRVAIGFDPENAELKAAHAEAQRAADQLLVDQYLKQAEYEERSERWADAGRSWGRVARTQPTNAKAQERAAFCVMKADGDLHDAVALAQRAVQLEPKNAGFRRTMANVYLAAGLALNAKRELEAVLQLAPDDPATVALLKRIGK